MNLGYALGVPKSFWLNLQANYEAELLEYRENHSIEIVEPEAQRDLKDDINTWGN